jgi:hypothetical protein
MGRTHDERCRSAEKVIEFLVFSSPVRLDSEDFLVEEFLYMILEFLKNLELVLKQEYPSEFTIIINKCNIRFISFNRITSRSPYIIKY